MIRKLDKTREPMTSVEHVAVR